MTKMMAKSVKYLNAQGTNVLDNPMVVSMPVMALSENVLNNPMGGGRNHRFSFYELLKKAA